MPLLRLMREHQLTSLADLFAFRYSSQLAGVLVTLFMLAGTLPYIALQIRAVVESVAVLSDYRAGSQAVPLELGLLFCVVLILFAILFGARHLAPRQRHDGLVLAIAFESLVKLAAILGVAGFALFGVFGGFDGLSRWLAERPQAALSLADDSPWRSLLLLSFAAAFLLPRQFHLMFVENHRPQALYVAAWLLPLFLLLFNLAIPLILWAGQAQALAVGSEYYTLAVTLDNGTLLPLLAFIGGISAASAMVIVTTLALSQMALNHLLLPASYPDPQLDMYGWLLWGRRMLITAIIMISYLFYLFMERSTGLVELGLISFVAVAQFLPGMIGVLFWPHATRSGFVAGLLAGALVWYFALVEPLLFNSGLLATRLDLVRLLGLDGQNVWAVATFWSLAVNGTLFVLCSLFGRQDDSERRAVDACFRPGLLPDSRGPDGRSLAPLAVGQLRDRLGDIIGRETGVQEVAKALADLGLDADEQRPHQLRRLRDRVERNLSGLLGPLLARMISGSPAGTGVGGSPELLADHIRFIEDRLEQSRSRLDGLTQELDGLRRYHRQILQDLPLGACSLSADGEILNWNQALERLSGIDRGSAIGLRLQHLAQPWAGLLTEFVRQPQQHRHKTRLLIGAQPRWFNLHKAAILPAAGQDRHPAFGGGLVLLIEDLTELQTLEAELAHSERLASIGRLAAGVAHEIGNPITGIACLAQNLQYETDPAEIDRSVADILAQTERVSVILRSLLSFSHGGTDDADHALSGYRDFNLHDCIAEAQRLVRLSHHAKQLNYANDCPPDLSLQGDRQRLLQVLVNLLSNASDASQPGDRVTVGAETDGGQVVLRIGDQGVGIAEGLRERVFEPFFTTKQPGEGTGLGLPLVYNIVRDHGGTVDISSRTGQGTEVTVRLPRYRTDPKTPALPAAEPGISS